MVLGQELDIGRVDRHHRMKIVEMGNRSMTKSMGAFN